MRTQSTSPYRRPAFLASAALVAVIAMLGVVAIVGALFDGKTPDTSVPVTAPADAQTISEDDLSVCGLSGYATTDTLNAAPSNTWELVGTVAAPTDPAVGPGVKEDDNFRSCYAHTAEGALFAVANYAALSTDKRNFSRRAELFLPGPGVAAATAAAANATAPATTTGMQVAGFKISSYSGEEATVTLALSFDGALVAFPIVVRWHAGDWKIVLTDDGELPYSPSALTSLGGYMPWAGA